MWEGGGKREGSMKFPIMCDGEVGRGDKILQCIIIW